MSLKLAEIKNLIKEAIPDAEITIQDYIENENANIISFTRLKVGEGIEVDTKDLMIQRSSVE